MILKKFISLRNHLLHIAQYSDGSLKHGCVAVHMEQTVSQLCFLSYNVSSALQLYLFAVAAFKFAIIL